MGQLLPLLCAEGSNMKDFFKENLLIDDDVYFFINFF